MSGRPLPAPWFSTFRRNGDAPIRLICFPYAGGTAAVYRHWLADLPPDIELSAIRLPGRAERAAEPLATAWAELVPPLSAALLQALDRPFAFFGHSLGAILGFEVARDLRRRFGIVPQRLIVSGRRAPHLPARRLLGGGSDKDLLERLRELNGTPPEILCDPDVIALIAPRLRADFTLADSYRYEPDRPLECPITAIGGSADEESQGDRLDEWRSHTAGAFARHVFDGDHFFLHTRQRELLALVAAELDVGSADEPATTADRRLTGTFGDSERTR